MRDLDRRRAVWNSVPGSGVRSSEFACTSVHAHVPPVHASCTILVLILERAMRPSLSSQSCHVICTNGLKAGLSLVACALRRTTLNSPLPLPRCPSESWARPSVIAVRSCSLRELLSFQFLSSASGIGVPPMTTGLSATCTWSAHAALRFRSACEQLGSRLQGRQTSSGGPDVQD